jgi:hypothetical protein
MKEKRGGGGLSCFSFLFSFTISTCIQAFQAIHEIIVHKQINLKRKEEK